MHIENCREVELTTECIFVIIFVYKHKKGRGSNGFKHRTSCNNK